MRANPVRIASQFIVSIDRALLKREAANALQERHLHEERNAIADTVASLRC